MIKVDWSECPLVEVDPERLSGRPVLIGTRMPADDVVQNFESGSPVEEIAYNFDLEPEDIRKVLAYAKTHQPLKPVR
jgi:uncharacterized protein (DUF433 family)